MLKDITEGVCAWQQDVVIPTYSVSEPDKNPIFLEKRVYQGSSGRVYPHSVIDKISDEKKDQTYLGIFLENKYLHVMILPQLGGRIQRALDKTNNYDFVYYNHVIKPALVGLAGPWISGGIEFNWPQHHRPSTFDPVNYFVRKNPDGSCSVVISEIENMFRTKGMATFTLYPDKAYIEISVQLYNRTEQPQTFLWWANPAVAVNDFTQSVFPPDVTAVMDHGKRDVSNFPIATGTYYKMDYSAGVDISRYKNIPVPTSYMAYHSDYDFVGGYDHQKQAGLLHVANHHVSPGKKQWTWGCGDFGQAWDRNLTDEDGPYIELMTGCFTDNQPDFSWLAPYEEKVFTQYFMPYKQVGMVKNATRECAVNLELREEGLFAAVYTTSEYKNAIVTVTVRETVLMERILDLSPFTQFSCQIPLKYPVEIWDSHIAVKTGEGRLLTEYQPTRKKQEKLPEPAVAAPGPEDVRTTEDLYLYGQHLEQYRHATLEPTDYYLEGLKRDPTDSRLNNALGSLLMRRGRFDQALVYLEAAVNKLTRSNPNPYDGEAHYNLGLCLLHLGEKSKAYSAFYKATWNDAWQGSAFYHLACMDACNGDLDSALFHSQRAVIKNYHNMRARGVQAILLRKTGQPDKADRFLLESLEIDCMDFISLNELALLRGEGRGNLFQKMDGNFNNCIELALEYGQAGNWEQAAALLDDFAKTQRARGGGKVSPLLFYHKAYALKLLDRKREALQALEQAASCCSDYCFPHRIEDATVLEYAIAQNPSDSKAPYYLGCLWYDKKQYEKAISYWQTSVEIYDNFATAHRNLALAYYNKRGEATLARTEIEKAFALSPNDSRVLMELDQLYKKLGMSFQQRFDFLKKHQPIVEQRDDLYLEFIILHNALGLYETAMNLIEVRSFHPWEGGEGKVHTQYVLCRTQLAKRLLTEKNYVRAIELLWEATVYPHNLGEGKLAGAQENLVYYLLGCAYAGQGNKEEAEKCYVNASLGLTEPAGMLYYNDQPPETLFYQGIALRALGRESEAYNRFEKLIVYGEKHVFDQVKTEYFAVSLPELMIFDEDMNRKNQVHCYFLMGLGYLGLGKKEKAHLYLTKAGDLEPNHLGVKHHLELL